MSNVFDLNIFRDIESSDVSPVYAWLWNSEITEELIEEQTDEMIAQGIRAAYILPMPKGFRPTTMVTPMSPEYLSEDFFNLVGFAIDCAEKKNISMWLYDEGGWPSGSACGEVVKKYPDCRAKVFAEKEVMLNAGEILADEGVISAFDEEFRRLEMPFAAQEPCRVFVYYVKELDTNIPYLLDERAVKEFINSTYEGYKKNLGDRFRKAKAIFTDEPILPYPYYIKNVSEFEKQSGFGFADNIPALFHDGFNSEFKIEYIDYCAKEFEKHYMKILHSWCKDNGILLTGHMDGDNALSSYERQVGNALRHLRNMDIPGVDVILRQIFPGNESNNFFPRLASSAAKQIGGNLAVSESFAVFGSGLTYEQMRYVCNYQLVRGINIINFMSVTSGRDRCLAAQWRPHFVPQLPSAEYRRDFNNYLSRMMYLCRLGRVQVDAALYMPLRDAWGGDKVSEEEFYSLGKRLEENQVYFDIVDDDLNYHKMYKRIFVPGEETENISEYSLVKCDSKHIRVMKRCTRNESIYILFNDSDKSVDANIEFFEKDNGYVLNCLDGTAERLENFRFSFCGGEAYAVIFTEQEIDCFEKPKTKEECLRINSFDIRVINNVEYDGEKLTVNNCGELSDSFSGSAVYTAYFDYNGYDNLEIDLGEIYYYAKIYVNGSEIKKLMMRPYRAVIDSKYLKPKNKIEIVVTNTAANTFANADYSKQEPAVVGTYNKITLEFEKESCKFGMNEAILYKIR